MSLSAKSNFFVLFGIAALVLGIPLLSWVWIKASMLRGEYQAYQDVRQGHYIELGYGLPVPWRHDFAMLVHQRYPEAEFKAVAGCIVTPQLEEYVRGYNSYVQHAAMKHFGHDVFQEALDDAGKTYKTKKDISSIQ